MEMRGLWTSKAPTLLTLPPPHCGLVLFRPIPVAEAPTLQRPPQTAALPQALGQPGSLRTQGGAFADPACRWGPQRGSQHPFLFSHRPLEGVGPGVCIVWPLDCPFQQRQASSVTDQWGPHATGSPAKRG